LRLPLNVQKQKVFQLQGGFASLTPLTRVSASGSHWRLRSQAPVIGSRSVRSPWPLCQILNTPLADISYLLEKKKFDELWFTNKKVIDADVDLLKFKIWRDFRQLQTLTTNISGAD